jgi:hypothetical protein
VRRLIPDTPSWLRTTFWSLTLISQFHGHFLEMREDRGAAKSLHKSVLHLHGGMTNNERTFITMTLLLIASLQISLFIGN